MNFSASAMKWVMPHMRQFARLPFQFQGSGMLARFGPRRSCIIADCRRSSQVRIDASGMRKPMIMKAIFDERRDDVETERTVFHRQPRDPAKRSWSGS